MRVGASGIRPTETKYAAAAAQISDVITGIVEYDDIRAGRWKVVLFTRITRAEVEAAGTAVSQIEARRVDIIVPSADGTADLAESAAGYRWITT